MSDKVKKIQVEEKHRVFAKRLADELNAFVVKTHWTEEVLVGPGYAGRADALLDHTELGTVLVDLKNRSFDPDKVTASRRPIYPTDAMQLSAYRLALGKKVGCVSIVCSSRTPAKPFVHAWDEQELEAGLDAFHNCQRLWVWMKRHTPKGTVLK